MMEVAAIIRLLRYPLEEGRWFRWTGPFQHIGNRCTFVGELPAGQP
jgi:hypothetical protein